MNKYMLMFLGLSLIMFIPSRSSELPRGIRNNNPMNLVQTRIMWNGKIPLSENTDGRFEQFESPFYGIRAGARDLWNDYNNKGLITIRMLIGEFAPTHENNTDSYIKTVASDLGISEDRTLIFPDQLPAVVKAIIKQENGAKYVDYYSDQQINVAVSEAIA